METRSALDWIRHAGSQIDVPAEHVEAGFVEASDWESERLITIHSSKRRPKDAVVAISFRGWWYYVDASDMESKRAFKLITILVGFRLEENGAQQKVPVLTVPVG